MASNEIAQSEEHFRTIFNSIGDAVIVTDTNGRVTMMNPVAEQLTGWSMKEAEGRSLETVFRIIDAGSRQKSVNPVKRVLKTGSVVGLANHTALISKDGSEYQISDSAAPIVDAQGKTSGVVLVFRDVSDAYKMQQQIADSAKKLQQNVEELNAIINALPGLVTVVDKEFNVLVANEEVVKRFGHRDMTEVIGKKCYKSRKGIDTPCPQCGVLTAYETGEVVSRVSTPDEEKLMGIATKAYAIPLKDKDGVPWAGVEVIMDITDIRRKEKSRRESEERMELALQGADLGLWDWNPTAGSLTFDVRWAEMLGYQLDELAPTFHTWEDLVHPDDLPFVLKTLTRHLEGQTPRYEAEHRLRTKDGSWKWILSRGQVLERDDKGRPMRAAGTHLDISRHKQAEAELFQEKERLNVTLRSIGDGVITTDTDGMVTMMNSVAEQLTGWTQDEALGRPLNIVFSILEDNFTKAHCENPVFKVLRTGATVERSNYTCLVSKSGDHHIVIDTGTPIKDDSGNIIGVVLVFRDMTEKIRVNETLQRTAKMDSLGILAGGIAHDFNNLLGGIYGYIELACELSSEDNCKKFLSKATHTLERARGLTQQLLTFSKGGAPIKNTDNLFPFVEETATFALSGSNVSCDCSVQTPLWPSCFDKNQIGQVIDNIVINAKQAMPNGGKIRIAAENVTIEKNDPVLSPGRYVRISIEDRGIGIPKDILPRIFDPFYTTKTKGHGLGLATCYSIIHRHDGYIEAESEPGKGSTFHIMLPAADALNQTVCKHLPLSHSGSGTFLIMDDEAFIREILETKLKSMGYQVVSFKTGEKAVEYFISNPDHQEIVGAILDLTVPGGMGGKEIVKQIKKHCPDIPVFVASGYAKDPVMSNPEHYGFTGSICKPFRMNALTQMISEHLQSNVS